MHYFLICIWLSMGPSKNSPWGIFWVLRLSSHESYTGWQLSELRNCYPSLEDLHAITPQYPAVSGASLGITGKDKKLPWVQQEASIRVLALGTSACNFFSIWIWIGEESSCEETGGSIVRLWTTQPGQREWNQSPSEVGRAAMLGPRARQRLL